jgi:hypothetical protein
MWSERERIMWIRRIIPVYWSALQPLDPFQRKRRCPFCADGILGLTRDPTTLTLSERDSCLNCGQRVRYLDIGQLKAQEEPPSCGSS